MTRSRPITFLAGAAVIPLVALAVAACGGGGDAATAAAAGGVDRHVDDHAREDATVGVAKSSLGSILVNVGGRTLYLFRADSGTMSACAGACASAWPPLLATGTPTAGTGLTASKLGTITRSGGTRQVTYNGHPLYLFIKDTKARPDNRPGCHRVRRRLVRAHAVRKPGLRTRIELRQRWWLWRSRLLGHVRSTSPHTAPGVRRLAPGTGRAPFSSPRPVPGLSKGQHDARQHPASDAPRWSALRRT